MSLTIDLQTDVEHRLEAVAAEKGVSLNTYVRQLIETVVEVPLVLEREVPFSTAHEGYANPVVNSAKARAAESAEKHRALFAKWAEEDERRLATMTPEEIAAEDAEMDEMQQNLRKNRVNFPVPRVI